MAKKIGSIKAWFSCQQKESWAKAFRIQEKIWKVIWGNRKIEGFGHLRLGEKIWRLEEAKGYVR